MIIEVFLGLLVSVEVQQIKWPALLDSRSWRWGDRGGFQEVAVTQGQRTVLKAQGDLLVRGDGQGGEVLVGDWPKQLRIDERAPAFWGLDIRASEFVDVPEPEPRPAPNVVHLASRSQDPEEPFGEVFVARVRARLEGD